MAFVARVEKVSFITTVFQVIRYTVSVYSYSSSVMSVVTEEERLLSRVQR